MQQKYTDQQIIKWINNSQRIGGEIISDIFCIYLEYTIKNDWKGACHDLSASFYMTLLEYDFKPKLCIGVAEINGCKFDHSWVDIDNEIYDFSICNQNDVSFPPIFSSKNLDNLCESNISYGVGGIILDESTKRISELTIDEYQKIRPKDHICIYEIAATFGSIIPSINKRKLDAKFIKEKYSQHKRFLIIQD